LNEEHCIVETAYNGEVALELIEDSIKSQREFSVIFLDNYMPLFSGDEVVNTLRLLEKNSGRKRACTVSISGDVSQMKDKNKNFDINLGKPFSKSEIRDIFYKSISR